jgi:flavin-dependent dehydrogenase
MGTWKRHVILKPRDEVPEDYVPVPFLGRPPFNVELRTLHVDRARLDEELQQRVIASGVTLIRDTVVGVERTGNQVDGVRTSSGERFSSPWFVDASGFATSLLAREFDLRVVNNGPPKVAMWTYFPVTDPIEGTTLYMEAVASEYLDWIWEIPINPGVVSVGYVTTGAAMKSKREQGHSVEEIFQKQLARFSRFESVVKPGALSALNVTSFRCRVHVGVAGPNWLIVGEAASMVDPITANGVTAALRHAAEASQLILKHRERGKLPLRARIAYSARVLHVARFFNSGIENVVYQPPIRNRIGLRHSGTAYISPAWGMNLVYSRLRPDGIVSTYFCATMLGVIRCVEWIFYRVCKLFSQPAGVAG